MSKLPTFGVNSKNSLRLQPSIKIKSPFSSPTIESNYRSLQRNKEKKENKGINVGDYVHIKTANQNGTVRYVGETKFKAGIWVGVELEKRGSGKNNGTVMGVTYFKCPPATGLFVPITVVEQLNKNSEIDNNPTTEASTYNSINKHNLKNEKKLSINTNIEQNSMIDTNLKISSNRNALKFKPNLITKSNSLKLTSPSSLNSAEEKTPKSIKSTRISNTLPRRNLTLPKIHTKSTSLSTLGLPSIDKKLTPSDLKENNNHNNTIMRNNSTINNNRKDLLKELKGLNTGNSYDGQIYKRDSVKTLGNNEEKVGVDLGNDSGFEDGTIKINENYKTNDDGNFSERLSENSSTINGSPQERKRSLTFTNFNIHKNEIKLPNSTPVSPKSHKSNSSLNSEKLNISISPLPIYPESNVNLPPQEEENMDKEDKSIIHSKSLIISKSNTSKLLPSKTLKSSKSLFFDPIQHKDLLKSKIERSSSFSSPKNLKFVDKETIKNMYEQQKDFMNNSSEEMRDSLNKFQTLIDQLTQQNSLDDNKSEENSKESEKVIDELTNELMKAKEESKELKEKLNDTNDKMNSLLDENKTLEKLLENIKYKKDNIQQDYQNNLEQLHEDIEEKEKKLASLESKFRYYFEQYNTVQKNIIY